MMQDDKYPDMMQDDEYLDITLVVTQVCIKCANIISLFQ